MQPSARSQLNDIYKSRKATKEAMRPINPSLLIIISYELILDNRILSTFNKLYIFLCTIPT